MKNAIQDIPTLLGTKEASTPDGISPWCVSKNKRRFDIIASCLLLALTSPVMLMIALFVRMSSRGPILFRQVRVGRSGKHFSLLKFRTMAHGPQNQGPALTQRA